MLDQLRKPDFYNIPPSDPTADAIGIIVKQVKTGLEKDGSPKGTVASRSQMIKHLVKIHKQEPLSFRFLLTGCGTPTQPASKFGKKGRVFDIADFRQKGIPTQVGNDQPEVCSFADIYGFCCLWCSFLVALIQPYVVNWDQSTSQLNDFKMFKIPRVPYSVVTPPPPPTPPPHVTEPRSLSACLCLSSLSLPTHSQRR